MGKTGTQALIAGILSVFIFPMTYSGGMFLLVLNTVVAIAAIIVGSKGIKKAENTSEKVQSIIGLILGAAIILLGIVLALFNN